MPKKLSASSMTFAGQSMIPTRLAGHPNELAAALMVVEEAVAAIEGYANAAPFNFVDEAYLAKYGVLQALRAGFDGAESAAKVLGIRH
jgi:hypothetical protein